MNIMIIKKNLKMYMLLAVLVSNLFISCSESENKVIDDSPEENLSELVMQDFASTINDIQIPSSLAQSSDPYGSQVNLQIQLFKGFTSAFASLFTVPENAVTTNSQTYTWSAQGISFNYKITESSDRYTFSYDIVSQEYTGNYLSGYQLKDGSVAEITFLGNGEESLKLKWTNLDNVAKMEMDVDGSKLILESNLDDNSGSMKIYDGGKLSASISWNADGSGTYVDNIDGGTFTF